MKRKPNTSCNVCRAVIYRRPSQIRGGGVFCSLKCTGKSQRNEKICKICGTAYVGGKKTCSRTCANKSRAGIVYTKRNAFNKAYKGTMLKEKVAQKRGGVCERCGVNNYAILQVHHKIERHKGGKDTLSNLELLCPNCHTTHHQGSALYAKK